MDRLFYLYLVSAIFGAGVILIDFFSNALSSFQSGDDNADGDADGEANGDELPETIDDTGDDDSPHQNSEDTAPENYDSRGSIIADYKKYNSKSILQFISFLRTLVYFCAGFGVIGSFALLTGESATSSLMWSLPVGIITVLLFKAFKKIQQKKLDSSFSEKELVNLKGEALLPIKGKSMGKVRLFFGSLSLERYAMAANSEEQIKKGDKIVISSTGENVVYVKRIS
jgi:membrane protein implicated in regulation of membrane protease activity